MAEEAFQTRVPVPGSARLAHRAGHFVFASAHEYWRSTVTVCLRRGLPISRGFLLPREKFAAIHSPLPDDVLLVSKFAAHYGLEVGRCDNAAATIQLSGREGDLCAAFGCSPRRCLTVGRDPTKTYHSYLGELSVPAELDGVVLAVLGMDEGPVLKPRYVRLSIDQTTGTDFTTHRINPLEGAPQPIFADQLNKAYNIPAGKGDGSGLFVGIYSLGGGYVPSDLAAGCRARGFEPLRVIDYSVDGAQNNPGDDAQVECTLDITDAMFELAKAGLSKATIVACFGQNSEQGSLNLVNGMIAWRDPDTGNPLRISSCSWGSSENNNPAMLLRAVDDALAAGLSQGIPFASASGDDGSSDGGRGLNVDFFASSPHCLAVGGTLLVLNADGSRAEELAWGGNGASGASGGGVSDTFAAPAFQQGLGFKSRALPDLAANGDPRSGSWIYITDPTTGVAGWMPVGGTSAATPICVGGLAIASTWIDGPLGDLHSLLYAHPEIFFDVTNGSNGAYQAKAGYDLVTGLGVPDFTKLRDALVADRSGSSGTTTTQPPVVIPTPAPHLNILESLGLAWIRRGGGAIHTPAVAGDDVSIKF
jgi:kumamolisin